MRGFIIVIGIFNHYVWVMWDMWVMWVMWVMWDKTKEIIFNNSDSKVICMASFN